MSREKLHPAKVKKIRAEAKNKAKNNVIKAIKKCQRKRYCLIL